MDNKKRYQAIIYNGAFYFILTVIFLLCTVIFKDMILYKVSITCLGLAIVTTLLALLFIDDDIERPLYLKVVAFLFMLPLILFILFFVILFDIFFGKEGGDENYG